MIIVQFKVLYIKHKESISDGCMINEFNRTFTEVAVMHILVFILIFVVGSIIAACDGDYS